MHLNTVYGDFKFAEWEDCDWKMFRNKVQELRDLGYRKVEHFYDFSNHYQIYKKKRSKKKVVLTMMCL
ncbi:hypothetical protein ACFQZE_06990 [Paenibacillus sp. GCM10027627]|uniref:hypothetical protein n=1 Tax=unclassified Paenibacillus TaxID=185978 RepID=UPI0036412718